MTMNLDTLASSGEVNGSGSAGAASCSLSSLLGLGVCRSRAEAAQSFAKKLQTKLWSLGPSSSANGLASGEDDAAVDSSWLSPGSPTGVAVEARLDLNRGVVTTVPVKSPSSSSLGQLTHNQHFVMEKGNLDERHQEQHVIKVAQWMGSNSYGSSSSNIGAAAPGGRDHESDASSTTTNPLSDSDQYFDFGIETPLDGDSSAGEEPTVINNQVNGVRHDDQLDHIVINHDDGLPAQPESGCIFGSPVLSGEESDEVEAEEASFYESLSQSPASASFMRAQQQQQQQQQLDSSATGENDDNEPAGQVGWENLPTPPASPSKRSGLFSFAHAHQRITRDPTPPRDNGAHGHDSLPQGELEGVANSSEVQQPEIGRDLGECEPVSQYERRLSHDDPDEGNEKMVVIVKSSITVPIDSIDQLHLYSQSEDVIRIRPSDDNEEAGEKDHVYTVSVDVQRVLHDLEAEDKTSSDQYGERNVQAPPSSELPSGDNTDAADTTDDDVTDAKKTREASVSPARDDNDDGDVEDESEDDNNQLYRHRVQRSTSLKTGKTPPGTPGRKKIVRFADALGLDLALVRTFLDEVPNVPPSAFNDLSGVEPADSDLLFGTSPLTTGRTTSYLPISSRTGSAAFGGNRANLFRSLVASFAQPGSLPNFLDLVKQQKVCLETACLVEDMRLRGVVRVLNLDFHKSVLIRFTTDEWTTQTDQMAVYVPGSCDGLSDRFSFTLAGAQSLQPGQRLIFALCYRVAGQEIWDSNQGKNYVFQCISNSSYVPSIALQPPQQHHQSPTHDSFNQHDSFLPYM